jgi:hypothetical protein
VKKKEKKKEEVFRSWISCDLREVETDGNCGEKGGRGGRGRSITVG